FNLIRPDPNGIFRSAQTGLSTGREWNGAGIVFAKWMEWSSNATFSNFWNANFSVTHDFRRLDDLDTRGGPPIVKPAGNRLNFNIGTDSRKTWQLSMNMNGGGNDEGAWNAGFGPSLRMQPSPQLQSSISASYTQAHDMAQWIANRDVTGDGVT